MVFSSIRVFCHYYKIISQQRRMVDINYIIIIIESRKYLQSIFNNQICDVKRINSCVRAKGTYSDTISKIRTQCL